MNIDRRVAGGSINFSASAWNGLQESARRAVEMGGDPRFSPRTIARAGPPEHVVVALNRGTGLLPSGSFVALSGEAYDPLELAMGEAAWRGPGLPIASVPRFPEDVEHTGLLLDDLPPDQIGRVAISGRWRYVGLEADGRTYGEEATDLDRAVAGPSGALFLDIVGPHIVVWHGGRAGGVSTRSAVVDINAADASSRAVRIYGSSGDTAGTVTYDFGDLPGRWRVNGARAMAVGIPNYPTLAITPHPNEINATVIMRRSTSGESNLNTPLGQLVVSHERASVAGC